jgi:hypothetical protein
LSYEIGRDRPPSLEATEGQNQLVAFEALAKKAGPAEAKGQMSERKFVT